MFNGPIKNMDKITIILHDNYIHTVVSLKLSLVINTSSKTIIDTVSTTHDL